MSWSSPTPRQRILQKMLREERLKAGLSQAELAQRLGRPQSFISNYEHSGRRIDILELFQLAEAIEFNPTAFLRKLKKALS
jgi:transcriptional regulator with XRE-family HTH domain